MCNFDLFLIRGVIKEARLTSVFPSLRAEAFNNFGAIFVIYVSAVLRFI